MDEDFDFERRRELRRQKREEMQREAEKMNSYDDDEEAARERRRRARQERLRNMENEESSNITTESNSTETSSLITSSEPAEDDDDQALLERIAKREERRQKRMKEALERQKELDPTITNGTESTSAATEIEPKTRRDDQESSRNDLPSTETNSWKEKEELKVEEKLEERNVDVEDTVPVQEKTVPEEPKASLEEINKPDDEDRPTRSYLREQKSMEEKPKEPTNKEESVSAIIEIKEQTNRDLASADLELKKVEDQSLIPEPANENKIEVEVKMEADTPKIEEEKLVMKEDVEKPEEKLVEAKAQIQDEAPVKKEIEKLVKEQEKPSEIVEETPKKSIKEIEVKAKIPKKEEEKPQLKKEFVEKPSTSLKKVEEKPLTPKKEAEEKIVAPKKAVEEKTVTQKKEVEEKTFIPKKEVEEKPKWKKEAEEAKAKVEEKVKSKKEEVVEEKSKPSFLRDRLKVSTKPQDLPDSTAKAKKQESTLSPSRLRSPETEKQDPIAKLEAERKLQELKRRRNETDSEALEKMKQKQQTAEAELEELRKKREERKKVLEEEEKQKKQQQADKRAKEEEERRKMKEEIERRRAEAAEKKKQKEESKEGSKVAFIAPKGASAKIGEKAEFLNKSALKSPIKTSHTPLVCKIGNRLEQYTSAVQTKEVTKSPKSPVDVPVAEGLRSIKSMWEKGNVVNPTPSPASPPVATKETAGLNIGVAGRINSWKTKTPEPKPAEPKPAPEPEKTPAKTEQKPAEVTKPRGSWETKGSTPAKVFAAKSKFVTNGTRK
ncbi:caldesmon 1b isoform X1 [Danio rerio]|uniref:Caldesmon 1b isoform X1 n=1 Tax=Danio rerio TaxID=7955 RepID=A0AC58IVH5_DANRE